MFTGALQFHIDELLVRSCENTAFDIACSIDEVVSDRVYASAFLSSSLFLLILLRVLGKKRGRLGARDRHCMPTTASFSHTCILDCRSLFSLMFLVCKNSLMLSICRFVVMQATLPSRQGLPREAD